MSIYGTYQGFFAVADGELYVGEKDGTAHVEVSYTSIGEMHQETYEVELRGDYLNFQVKINDFYAKIELEKQEENLKGTFHLDMVDMHVPLELEKKSDTYEFAEPYVMIPQENIDRLREHNLFEVEETENVITYDLENPKVLSYVREHGIDVDNHNDFATMCALMKRTSEVIHHDGVNYKHSEKIGTIAQFEHAIKQNNFTNCRGIAIILAGVFRAYGFRASYVECWPIEIESAEIHVVCEAFVPDLEKYVMFDVSNNLIYYLGEKPLSAQELRDACAAGRVEEIQVSQEASHNGEYLSKEEALGYQLKNLVYLRKMVCNDEEHEISKETGICLGSKELLGAVEKNNLYTTCNPNLFYG